MVPEDYNANCPIFHAEMFDFRDEDITTLTDEVGTLLPPTRKNIVSPIFLVLFDWTDLRVDAGS